MPLSASTSGSPTTCPGTSVCIAVVMSIPCRSRNSRTGRRSSCSSSVEQVSVCRLNGIAVSSIRPSRTRSRNRATCSGGRFCDQFSKLKKPSTAQRNFDASGRSSVARHSSRRESRYLRPSASTVPCGSVYPMSRWACCTRCSVQCRCGVSSTSMCSPGASSGSSTRTGRGESASGTSSRVSPSGPGISSQRRGVPDRVVTWARVRGRPAPTRTDCRSPPSPS